MGREQDVRAIRAAAHELTGVAGDFDPLLRRIGEAGCVLLGESTHGTEQFYAVRAHITKRLIEEKGFRAVAVEADWPDAYRAGRWARGADDDPDAAAALGDFTRFPRWMWRNHEVVAFLRWVRERNAEGADVGFYGLDLYSLHASIDKVVRYLDEVDPAASARARERYGCFDTYGGDTDDYGRAAAFGAGASCEAEVVDQLVELQRRAGELSHAGGRSRADAHFFAEENARLVRNAERYHRAMFRVGPESWNVRDGHMADTLDALRTHLADGDGRPGKVVVWAHNSHVGDARATEAAQLGHLSLGQLARAAYGDDAVLVGLSTYEGTVTAAPGWGSPVTTMRVDPAREDAHDALLQETGLANLLLVIGEDAAAAGALAPTRLQRAIGVVYRPERERVSHYVFAGVARQYDPLIHLGASSALEPLDDGPGGSLKDLPAEADSGQAGAESGNVPNRHSA